MVFDIDIIIVIGAVILRCIIMWVRLIVVCIPACVVIIILLR